MLVSFVNNHPILSAISSILFENPHSLSYQPNTRSIPPAVTRVSGQAITILSARARMSEDTSARSVTPITPPAIAAARNTAFTASTLATRSVITHKSTAETLATGTRTADPAIRPANPGSTVSSSRCADVVVGTIDRAAARDRAKSAAGASTVGCDPV